ncbi:MAG: LysM peptidoglycan-binding domain-containing protein [Pseudonocardiales bacterium]
MVSLSQLISPAGDPGPWRKAANTWRELAKGLEPVGADLDATVGTLQDKVWSGKDRDKFAAYWGNSLGNEFKGDQLGRYNSVAAKLDETADKIEQYNQLAHALEIAVAAGVVISIATAGLGTLFGAGEAAAAAAEAGVAYSALEVFLSLLADALIKYVTYWGATFVFGLTANAVAITVAAPDHNPINTANWSVRGLAEAANAATAVGSLGTLGVIGPVADFAAAHPFAWNFGTGAVAGGGPAVYNLLHLEHAKLYGDPRGASYDAWWKIAMFTGVSGAFNAGVGKLFGPKSIEYPTGALDDPAGWLPKGWVLTDSGLAVPKSSAFGRQPALIQSSELGFIPSTGLRVVVPFPKSGTATVNGVPSTLTPTIGDVLAPPAPVPLPPPPPPAPPPATIGGGNYAVHPGDSMWTIAGHKYGDPNLWTKIAAANPQIDNPSLIHPGDVLHIPKIRAPQPVS